MNCSSHWPPREIANQARLHCREWWALCSDIWQGFVRTTNISAQVTRTTGKIIQQTNSAHCQLCSNYRTSSVLNLVHDFFSSCISLFTYRKEEASARIKKKKKKATKKQPARQWVIWKLPVLFPVFSLNMESSSWLLSWYAKSIWGRFSCLREFKSDFMATVAYWSHCRGTTELQLKEASAWIGHSNCKMLCWRCPSLLELQIKRAT